MINDEEMLGWQYDQFLVAAEWAHRNGYTVEWGPSRALQAVQLIWRSKFELAPLEGAMQVYRPDIDDTIRMHVAISWVFLSSQDSSDSRTSYQRGTQDVT